MVVEIGGKEPISAKRRKGMWGSGCTQEKIKKNAEKRLSGKMPGKKKDKMGEKHTNGWEEGEMWDKTQPASENLKLHRETFSRGELMYGVRDKNNKERRGYEDSN